jgi:hypothetical protein
MTGNARKSLAAEELDWASNRVEPAPLTR